MTNKNSIIECGMDNEEEFVRTLIEESAKKLKIKKEETFNDIN